MWTMSMLRRSAPVRYEVFIGAVQVARISFGRQNNRSCCYLDLLGSEMLRRVPDDV
jgi:hypothetical protein